MILFLTYHAVAAGVDTRARNFYTVTREQLERHFDFLSSSGHTCISPTALREGKLIEKHHFVLSFDDATADHAEIVRPVLRNRGWTAAFFVPTVKLNKPGYLTDGEVRDLNSEGHTIGLHSHEHRRLDVLSDDQLREQMGRSQGILADLIGQKPWLFAPPGGYLNEHIREVALGFEVQAIRTMRWGYNQKLDLTSIETIPINRHTDDRKFRRIIETRYRRRIAYASKQAVKAIVPSRAYEWMRARLLKLAGRN
jgi:peptidoglycan/xylan/chitin deacetylase (PgdA/CDA1 family)